MIPQGDRKGFSLLPLPMRFTTHLFLPICSHHCCMLWRAQTIFLGNDHPCHKCLDILLEGIINLAFREPQRGKRNCQEFFGQRQSMLLLLITRNNLRDESHGETFMSTETPAKQAEALSAASANEPGKTHRAKGSNQTFFDGGNAEHGIRRSN